MSLKINILANYSGNFLMLIVNLLLVPIYLKFLTVEEYGLVIFFTTLLSSLVVLDMGLGLTVNREVASSLALKNTYQKTSDIVRTFESIYCAMAFLIGTIIFLSAEWISMNWLNVEDITQEHLRSIIRLIALAMMFRWPISFYENVLCGCQNMRALNLVKVTIGILNVSVLYALFYFFEITILGVFILLSVLYLAHVIFLNFCIWKADGLSYSKARFRFSIIKKTKRYILGISIYSIVGGFFVGVDKLIISKAFYTSDLGYYSLISMATLSLLQFVYPISSALFPKFVENYKKGEYEKCFDVFRKGYQLKIILVFSFSIVLSFFGENIIFLWTQNRGVTEKSMIYLNPLLLGTVFYSMHILIISIYTSLGKNKPVNIVYMTTFLIYLLMLIYSTAVNKITLIAYSWLISNLILMLLSFCLALKLLGTVKFRLFIKKDILSPFAIFGLLTFASFYITVPKVSFGVSIFLVVSTLLASILIFSMCSAYFRTIIYLRIRA